MAKLLVVDNEQTILSVLTTLLECEGHEIVPALGGEVAIKLLETQQFDLMLSDIRMDAVNGMDLLRLVHDNYPSTVVIMLTAYGQVETAIEAMELGAFDYIKKPFKATELIGTIDRALEFRSLQNEDG